MDITIRTIEIQNPLSRSESERRSIAVDLSTPNPLNLSNKGYRDTIIDLNIFRKAVQLYNDIVAARDLEASQNAFDIRTQIENAEFSSLNDLLKAHVNVHIDDVIADARGQKIDQSQ